MPRENKKPYEKPPLSISDQIKRLEKRNVCFSDRQNAEEYMRIHNYYSVCGYVNYFKKKVDFLEVIQLMEFDKALRIHCFGAILELETSLRSIIAYELSLRFGAFCLDKEEDIYQLSGNKKKIINSMDNILKRKHKDQALLYFTENYNNPYPPIWILVEAFSLGELSILFSSLKTKNKKVIAKTIGLAHWQLESWFKTITELRNVCAHHNRLWNRKFVNKPTLVGFTSNYQLTEHGENRFGAILIIFKKMCRLIGNWESWEKEFIKLVGGCKQAKPADMGLSNW